jgi:hypothetical protein
MALQVVKLMGPKSAQKKRKVEGKKAGYELEEVFARIDKRVGIRVRQMGIEERVRELTGKEGELNAQEAKSLAKSEEYAIALWGALESKNARKLDMVG